MKSWRQISSKGSYKLRRILAFASKPNEKKWERDQSWTIGVRDVCEKVSVGGGLLLEKLPEQELRRRVRRRFGRPHFEFAVTPPLLQLLFCFCFVQVKRRESCFESDNPNFLSITFYSSFIYLFLMIILVSSFIEDWGSIASFVIRCWWVTLILFPYEPSFSPYW